MPRIVYLSWPAGAIAGGIKAAFQHVSLLRQLGYEATVATALGDPPGWFETDAPLIKLDDVQSDDVLVFPENNWALLERFAASTQPKAVFCQNPFLVHEGLQKRRSYADYGVRHLLCASHTVMHYCRVRFPEIRAGYTPYFVDTARFRAPARKLMQIACAPRKRPMELGAIRDLFAARFPQFAAIGWVVIQNLNEATVAQVLGDSAIFLSLARFEAHSMQTLEAMACGCIVAGFKGVTGDSDSSTAANGFWCAEDDILGCVDQLAHAVQVATAQGAEWREMVENARLSAHAWRPEEATRLLGAYWRQTLDELAA